MAGAKSFGIPRIAYPISFSDISMTESPRLLGRFSAGAGPAEQIPLTAPFSISGGNFTALAAAQYNVMARKTAGAGDYEDSTRLQANIPGLELANVFTDALPFFSNPDGLTFSTLPNTTSAITVARSTASAGFTLAAAGNGAAFSIYRLGSSSGPTIQQNNSRGTFGAYTPSLQNDVLSQNDARFQTATAATPSFAIGGRFRFVVTEVTPSATAGATKYDLLLCPVGSVTLTEILRFEHATGFSMFGANVVIDQNRGLKRRAFTFGTLPAAATFPDTEFVITDGAAVPVWMAAAAGAGAVRTPVHSNGAAYLNG